MSQKKVSSRWTPGPVGVLQAAIEKVPAMKYALAVAGIVSVVALVASFGVDPRIAVFGCLVMLALMVSLVVFAKITTLASGYLHFPAQVMLWAFMVLTILAAFFFFTHVFFAWPPNLKNWIRNYGHEAKESSIPPGLEQKVDVILASSDLDIQTVLGDYRSTEQILESALVSLEVGNRDAPQEAAKLATAISRIAILYDPRRSLIFADRAINHDQKYYSAWNQRGRALFRLGLRKEAIEAYRMTIELCTDQENDLCLADQYRNLGLLFARSGDNREALVQHGKALSIYATLSNAEGIAAEHIHIGNILRNLGNIDEATQEVEKGLEMAKAVKKGDLIFLAENALGNIFMTRRRFREAETHFLLALSEATQIQSHSDIISALRNLSNAYSSQGRLDQALLMLDRSIEIGGKIGDAANLAGDLNNKGLIYFKQGKVALSRELHQRSLAMARDNGLEVEEAASLSNLGRIARTEGKPEEALTYFRQAFEIYNRIEEKVGVAAEASNIATAEHLSGSYGEAEKFYKLAIKLYRELEMPEQEGNNLSNLGELLLVLDRRKEAIDSFVGASGLFLQAGVLNKKEEVDEFIEKARRGESL
jgi:tetratricopeptide (TPR) repeat protein